MSIFLTKLENYEIPKYFGKVNNQKYYQKEGKIEGKLYAFFRFFWGKAYLWVLSLQSIRFFCICAFKVFKYFLKLVVEIVVDRSKLRISSITSQQHLCPFLQEF